MEERTTVEPAELERTRFLEYRKTHDRALRDELLQYYTYIPVTLMRKFQNRGVDRDDLYQVAMLGLLCAIDRFDPERGVRFATFATPTILGEIRRYFREIGNFIRMPRKLHSIFYKAEQLRRANGQEEKRSELSRLLNIPEETLEKAYAVGDAAFIKSLEDEAYADGQMNLASTLGVEDKHFLLLENHDFVGSCFARLSAKEKEFISLRYYRNLVQEEIAKKWGVDQSTVCRFEKKLLAKLNHYYFHEERKTN